MTVQAQSICATWRSTQPLVKTDADGSFSAQNMTYTFNEDGTFYFVDEVTESSEPAPTMALEIAMSIEIRGTYTLEGDKLTLTPNADSIKAELLSVSTNGKVTTNPMVTSGIKQMFNSPEFKEEFSSVDVYTVNSVNETTLVMSNGDDTMTFMRFATIAN